MPVRAWPWQQKSREGPKTVRWDAIGDFWTFPTKPCDKRGDSQQNPECNWSPWWSPNHGKETETQETILQGRVKGARRRGRQKKRWEDNIKEWTWMEFGDSLRAVEDREGWKGYVATSSVVPRRPPRLRDWDEMRWWCFFNFQRMSVKLSHIHCHWILLMFICIQVC